jgi:hypothetical protein
MEVLKKIGWKDGGSINQRLEIAGVHLSFCPRIASLH